MVSYCQFWCFTTLTAASCFIFQTAECSASRSRVQKEHDVKLRELIQLRPVTQFIAVT